MLGEAPPEPLPAEVAAGVRGVLLREFARVGVRKKRVNRVYEACGACAGETERTRLVCEVCRGTGATSVVVSDTEIVEQSVAAAIFFLERHKPEKYSDVDLGGASTQIDHANWEIDGAVERFSAEVARLAGPRGTRDRAELPDSE